MKERSFHENTRDQQQQQNNSLLFSFYMQLAPCSSSSPWPPKSTEVATIMKGSIVCFPPASQALNN
ncbi:hypothetical protein Cni_G19055 [Canna indica]|uniref:Uncharacterized protein n=1 Tax=Canna indica TaxID=4628 RepID=A0AAQ3KKJ7_9LILI|nr:hypothetical protein Cni_G19055 [Canna indica]